MKELFQRSKEKFSASATPASARVPDGLWVRCPACRDMLYTKQLDENFKVCPRCGHHLRLAARDWLGLLDEGSFTEYDANLWPADPLAFATGRETYAKKLTEAQARANRPDAVISGVGQIGGRRLALAICDFEFMGGSMGSVFGETMARAAERAAERGIPLLTINRSGGARMQEGILSLLQMAKVSMALTRLAAAGQLHISLLTDPCYGGVTASYASVADIIIAEPGANIGFAGKRVIEATVRQKLPPEFQTAEFMLKHGLVDMVTPRGDLRTTLAKLLKLYDRSDRMLEIGYPMRVEALGRG